MSIVLLVAAGLIVLRLVADLVLSALNRAEVRRHAAAPPPAVAAIMDQATYSKSVAYTLEKSRFGVITEIFDTLVLALVLALLVAAVEGAGPTGSFFSALPHCSLQRA